MIARLTLDYKHFQEKIEFLYVPYFFFVVCPDDTFECPHGRVDGQQPACISTEQRCDNVTDCIGGEDELEHNCPCGPEGAVRLVDGIVPYRGRVEYCRNGRWTSICNYYSYRWDNIDAAVVCRQLGYASKGSNALNVYLTLNNICTSQLYRC